MLRPIVVSAALLIAVVASPVAAQQQDETLADIRQELSVLYVELQRLKRELSTTGAPSGGIAGTGALERVDLIEAELQRLTAKTEQLEFRIEQVVEDGTNRVGDLEFRICEIEDGCEIGEIGDTLPLGGEAVATASPAPLAPGTQAPAPAEGGAEMAVGEQADFDRAKEALDAGQFQQAAELFGAFTQTYTGGPLTGEAHFFRGEALASSGQTSAAARAYLESFSGAPSGTRAPDALYKLGLTLGALGQTSEACVTLGQVASRYPGSGVVGQAATAMQTLGCG